jgi:hypothetical protein
LIIDLALYSNMAAFQRITRIAITPVGAATAITLVSSATTAACQQEDKLQLELHCIFPRLHLGIYKLYYLEEVIIKITTITITTFILCAL